MPSAAHTIDRLSRDELTSPAYRKLASELCGADNWEAHVRYCRWLFDENPAHRPDEQLPIYVCREGAELIGQFALIPVAVCLDGARFRAGWGIDFYVLRSHRRRQVGERFLTTWQTDYPLMLSIGQSNAGYQWTMKYGYHDGGSLTRCKQWLRPLRCGVKKTLEKAGLARVARTLFRGPVASAAPTSPGIQVEPITSFAEIADEQRDLRGGSDSATRICRTAAFMEWRYCRHPLFHYAVRRLRIEGHGDAYAVWRLIDDGLWRRASLVDLIYPEGWPQAVLERGVAVIMNYVRAEGADVFQCETSDPAIVAALRKKPLSVAEPGARFLYRAGGEHTFPETTAEEWRLYAGDGDLDTYMARGVRT